jgi:hypothetical protein
MPRARQAFNAHRHAAAASVPNCSHSNSPRKRKWLLKLISVYPNGSTLQWWCWPGSLRKRQAEGRVKVTLLPMSQIVPLADRYLEEHRAELLAQAAASPIVQNSEVAHGSRRPGNQTVLRAQLGVQNGGSR